MRPLKKRRLQEKDLKISVLFGLLIKFILDDIQMIFMQRPMSGFANFAGVFYGLWFSYYVALITLPASL